MRTWPLLPTGGKYRCAYRRCDRGEMLSRLRMPLGCFLAHPERLCDRLSGPSRNLLSPRLLCRDWLCSGMVQPHFRRDFVPAVPLWDGVHWQQHEYPTVPSLLVLRGENLPAEILPPRDLRDISGPIERFPVHAVRVWILLRRRSCFWRVQRGLLLPIRRLNAHSGIISDHRRDV